MREPGAIRLLPTLLASFSHKLAFEPRDRVFAVLSMLSEGSQDSLLKVDYAKPIERVFRDATEYIITRHQTLDHWSRMHFDPVVRSKYDIPSWVEAFDIQGSRFTIKYPPHLMQVLRLGDRLMVIEGNILTVHGIIFDTIALSVANFSEHNFRNKMLGFFAFCLSGERRAGGSDVEKFVRAAQKMLRLVNPYEVDRFKNDKAFFKLLSNLILWDIGIDASIVQQTPKLEDFVEAHPKLKETYPNDIESGKNIQDLVAKHSILKWMLEQTEVDDEPEYERGLKFEFLDEDLDVGRNIFVGKTGYAGVGPAGKCGAEGSHAAVQAGDVLTLVYGAPTPMILRPLDDGMYTVVGSCHVGNLQTVKSSVFKDGKLPEPVSLKIR